VRRTAVATLALLLSTQAVASADPPVPQPGTPCAPDLAGVMTMPADSMSSLDCVDNQWQAVTSPQPPNDRWLSLGPTMTLHGDGLRNPDLASGTWTAVPQDPTARCRAEQRTVVEAGVVGPPRVAEGAAGQSLTVEIAPQLYSVALSGHCLWTRTG
jgi:hypothetical protein